MFTLLQDLRYAFRSLRRAPAFAIVAVLCLGLGIGANSAMFSLIDALLFRPPARVSDPDQVVRLSVAMTDPTRGPMPTMSLSYSQFTALHDGVHQFSGLAAFSSTSATLGHGATSRDVQVILASGDYFSTLGVRPEIGRFLTRDDDVQPHGVPVVVLSHRYWANRMGSDPTVLGKPLELNGKSYTVVGVAPQHFVGVDLDQPDLWAPLAAAGDLGLPPEGVTSPTMYWLTVVGRLAPTVRREQARAAATSALRAVQEQLGVITPIGGGGPGGGRQVQITMRTNAAPPGGAPAGGAPAAAAPQRVAPQTGAPDARAGAPAAVERAAPTLTVSLDDLVSQSRATLGRGAGGQPLPVSLWLLVVSGVVLLIACANVANLLLARATQRRQEVAVRLSLGAPRARITRQFLTESLVLALAGAAVAVVLTLLTARLVNALPLPPLDHLVSARVLAFTFGVAVVSTLAFGLVPALRASRPDLTVALKDTAGRGRAARSLTRNALMVVQLALSLVLLVGAALLVRSLHNVRAINVGMDLDRVATASVDLRSRGMAPPDIRAFFDRAADRLRAIPGVAQVSLAQAVPFRMIMMRMVRIPGTAAADEPVRALTNVVDEHYFETLGIPLRAGRVFTDQDRIGTPEVAVVSETFARRYWPEESAIGKCIAGRDGTCITVVGVVADTRTAGLMTDPEPFFYVALGQAEPTRFASLQLHVRARGAPEQLAPAIRREMLALDPNLPYITVEPMTNLVRPQLRPWQMGTLAFGIFGALALVLAATGLYGVISFVVAQRTHEMGIRMALGAQRGDVMRLVLSQSGALVAIGTVVGVAGAAVGTRALRGLVYGVSPTDVPTFGAIVALLALVSLVASWAPARRATRVDPMVALRSE
ncbi:MAG TPA: ABC transporter permease [Gemmatimonadaceae bacterium]|nr:ABC transporter permease [Gemmatimonadaceae bacterium]